MKEETGMERQYVIKNNKKMRMGYTTGSCAAAAAQGAVRMLLGEREIEQVHLMTPKGIALQLGLEDRKMDEESASCAVRKDAGDDPDTTHGMLIYAIAKKRTDGTIRIDGGIGIGRVTKPGLSQQIGEAAINPVPMTMIKQEIQTVCEEFQYTDGIDVVIEAPEGEEVAKKTFNPRLGIVGGISILGTSGIVEPMSEAALIESIRVEMKQKVCQGEEYLLITPGNYGADYLREHMELPYEKNMKCSNYVGETIDMAVNLGVKGILFVAHIGKFVKLGTGIMNTHSHSADGRMEVLTACAIRSGCQIETARALLNCSTTDEALEILDQEGLLSKVMENLLEKIQFYLDHRSYERIQLGAVLFSNTKGYLGKTEEAEDLIQKINKNKTDKINR